MLGWPAVDVDVWVEKEQLDDIDVTLFSCQIQRGPAVLPLDVNLRTHFLISVSFQNREFTDVKKYQLTRIRYSFYSCWAFFSKFSQFLRVWQNYSIINAKKLILRETYTDVVIKYLNQVSLTSTFYPYFQMPIVEVARIVRRISQINNEKMAY